MFFAVSLNHLEEELLLFLLLGERGIELRHQGHPTLGQIVDDPNGLHQVERALIFFVSSPLKRVLLKKIFVDVENVEKPLRGSCHEVAEVC